MAHASSQASVVATFRLRAASSGKPLPRKRSMTIGPVDFGGSASPRLIPLTDFGLRVRELRPRFKMQKRFQRSKEYASHSEFDAQAAAHTSGVVFFIN